MNPLKSAIIGKMWTNGDKAVMVPASYTLNEDVTFEANQSFLIGGLSFRTDRNLSTVAMKAGDKLFFYANKKRDGKADPDYSVSVVLPEAEANLVIENSRAGAEAYRQAHPAIVTA